MHYRWEIKTGSTWYAGTDANIFLRSRGDKAAMQEIELNDPDDYNDDILVEGIRFSSAEDDADDANEATEGVAAPHEALIGVDFECGALLIYRLEVNDAGPDPFIVDLTVIPGESTR